MDEKTLMQYFSEVEGITDKNKVAEYIQKLDDNGKKQLKTKIQNWISKKKTAKHAKGAKINYLKSLKHICADDEEVVYFRSGGKADCGCKKKNGGEIEKASRGIVAKFKDDRNKINPADTVHVKGKVYSLTSMNGQKTHSQFPAYEGKVEKEDRAKAKKGDKDAQRRQRKAEEITAPKNGAKITKNCNGAVAKFKKHRQGGSLNGIPFYQAGAPKGIQYLPKKPLTITEAYTRNTAIADPEFQKYNNKANAYTNATPNIQNTLGAITNRLKAQYYAGKAGLQNYYDEADKYSRDQWNRGNYLTAIFGSPFFPITNR